MRLLVAFAVIIALPVIYLKEHAHGFHQCQRIAELQVQRQRLREVCDSLTAQAVNLSSNYRIGVSAAALGMVARFAPKPGLAEASDQEPVRKEIAAGEQAHLGRQGPRTRAIPPGTEQGRPNGHVASSVTSGAVAATGASPKPDLSAAPKPAEE